MNKDIQIHSSLSALFETVYANMKSFTDKDGNIDEADYSPYICDNIYSLRDSIGCKFNTDTILEARRIIQERIEKKFSVAEWLRDRVPEANRLYKKDPDKFDQQVNLYRLRWLKALAEEFR